jgi:hypothetical protein
MDFAPKGTENLSQEDDNITLNYTFHKFTHDGSYIIYGDEIAEIPGNGSFTVTWNKLFMEISPLMIDEADESSLRIKLNSFCSITNYDREMVTYKTYPKIGAFNIVDSDFHKIIIQLRALGLIKKSMRKRSIKDNDTYWQLTSYGDNLMTRLIAIKRL